VLKYVAKHKIYTELAKLCVGAMPAVGDFRQ